jgi:hypothetical protein
MRRCCYISRDFGFDCGCGGRGYGCHLDDGCDYGFDSDFDSGYSYDHDCDFDCDSCRALKAEVA